jgi:cell division protein FtsI/penicillin-binding protein 2
MIGLRRRFLALVTLAVVLAGVAEAPAATRSKRRTKTTSKRSAVRRPPSPPSVIVADPNSPEDAAVGEACRRGLGSLQGSALAMDPRTGRVIAVVNPGLGVERAYQPCSVFKIVVGLAGLSEGVITPQSQFNCRGGSCWLWPGHGPIDLRRALAVSCNPFFEWVGEQLGYAKVQHYARLLGLGEPSGLNLEKETGGALPLFVPPSLVGHVCSHAKGVATSAVQLGVLISATINGGTVYTPQLAPAEGFVPRPRWQLPESTVTSGMAEGFLGAVNEGSASTAFDPDIVVAGKTGTCAGVGWLASYAPADDPRIVIVTFVKPGSGHLASTVAGRIYQYLYKPAVPTSPVAPVASGGR